ncbi:MAG: hypothetical protein ACC613_02510 [Synergistales bacterium]|jgi:hypothetical protein
MLVAFGDLEEGCSFAFDEDGRLRLIFPDRSVILDGKDGVRVCDPVDTPGTSEALMWLERHGPHA